MTTKSLIRAAMAVLTFTVAGPPAPAGAEPLGVTVALSPSQQVTPGGVFDLSIVVTQAGDSFNGFDAVISYDPAALTLLPLQPVSLQEGPYLTAAACSGTFHRFRQGVCTDTITDVILCDGMSLPGPGQIYRLHFRASTTPQQTTVRFLSGTQFYNSGLYVMPLTTIDALIGIGMPPPADVATSAPPARISLKASPNPSAGGLAFTIECDRAGPETLAVYDIQGRMVRRWADDRVSPGVHTLNWDGRNEMQARLSPGTYLVRLEIAGRAAWSRVTLLH